MSRQIITDPVELEQETDVPAAGERPAPVTHLLVMIASLSLVVVFSGALRKFGADQGLPIPLNERMNLGWIVVGSFLFSWVREASHLLAAWTIGFRFREVAIGPFSLTERPDGGWGFRFSVYDVLASGGYRRAIPESVEGLRGNWILVSGAGPVTMLLLALVGFLGLMTLRGSELAYLWPWAEFLAVICAADSIASLLPFGQTAGATLFHLALGTARGEEILARVEEAPIDPELPSAAPELVQENLEQTNEPAELAVAAQGLDYATAALRNGRATDALATVQEAGKTLKTLEAVPNLLRFRYWSGLYDAATACRQLTTANEAREQAQQLALELTKEDLGWEAMVPVRIACARMWMLDGDIESALSCVQETRAECPSRMAVTVHSTELLAMEAECELRMGTRDNAEALIQTSIDVARELPDSDRTTAMELLAHTAVRLSTAGESEFAQPLFASALKGLGELASPSIVAGYRTAWAESLFENGRLAEASAVLAEVNAIAGAFALDIETLRAQLLLAEDRPTDALEVLSPLFNASDEELNENRRLGLARVRSLRSWALFRSGAVADALADARLACDILMPVENPDAAPALLTLAMSVAEQDSILSEAYLQEGARLICEASLYSPGTKASRLTELARGTVQAGRKDWAKTLLDLAAKVRGTTSLSEPLAAAAK